MGIAQMQVRGAAAATFARARLRAARTPGRTRSASGRQTESAQGTRQAAKLTRPATARAAPASAATVRGRGGGGDGLKRPRARARTRRHEARQRARRRGRGPPRALTSALFSDVAAAAGSAHARAETCSARAARVTWRASIATRSKAARETTTSSNFAERVASATRSRRRRRAPRGSPRPAAHVSSSTAVCCSLQCIITPFARPSLCHSSHPLT